MTYWRCDGVLAEHSKDVGFYQCSTGWVSVDEPVYTLLSAEQTGQLLIAILSIWAVWFIFQQIQKSI